MGPPGDTVSIPAIPSAVQRLLIWDLLAQLSSLVSLLYLRLAGGVASLTRRIASRVITRRVTLFNLLRAAYDGTEEVYVSLCQDCVWLLRGVLSAIAGVITAWSASTAGTFLLIAGAWNTVTQLLGAAMEGGKPAMIDSLDSLEFVHFLQTAYVSSVSPECRSSVP